MTVTTRKPAPAEKTSEAAVKPAQTPDKPAEAGEAPKRRGRKPGTPVVRNDYSKLSMDLLDSSRPTNLAERSVLAPNRARDAQQLKMDAIVRMSYGEWESAGKPTQWAQMPSRVFNVTPENAELLKALIRRSAEFLGMSIRFGASRQNGGLEVVAFCARDKRERGNNDDDE